MEASKLIKLIEDSFKKIRSETDEYKALIYFVDSLYQMKEYLESSNTDDLDVDFFERNRSAMNWLSKE